MLEPNANIRITIGTVGRSRPSVKAAGRPPQASRGVPQSRAVARPRVVIVGAGFAGLQCAKKLDGGPVDVLLVDRHNYHLFTPLLYQVATALLNPSDIAYPVRKVFRGSANVRFRQAEVTGYDLDQKTVTVATGPLGSETIAWDYLVLAAGSTTNFFGNEPVATRSLGLKTLGEALELRNHTLYCLEEASAREDVAEQRPFLTFVIVGGGPTGVEYAGALSELLRLVLAREYPTVRAEPRVLLVEANPRILGMFSERLSEYAKKRLEALGVETCLGVLVRTVEDDNVVLSDGKRIDARTLVWSAGVKPEHLAEALPRAERSKRVKVDGHLRVEGRSDVFAVGDLAAVLDDGHELPMVSPPAMQGGRYVADYILGHLADDAGDPVKLPPFRYVDKGTMATIGRNAAVCSVRGVEVTGFIGWVVWLVVHIYYLIGFRNRLFVLWSWAWNYIVYDRPVRIVAAPRKPPELPA
jgi:NADH:quinone reductase (non-electrogenic)